MAVPLKIFCFWQYFVKWPRYPAPTGRGMVRRPLPSRSFRVYSVRQTWGFLGMELSIRSGHMYIPSDVGFCAPKSSSKLRSCLISGRLELVLSRTEKSCIPFNYKQFPLLNITVKIIRPGPLTKLV